MLGEPAPIPSPPQRVVRVFISSTFRDMQAEHDELANGVELLIPVEAISLRLAEGQR